MDVVMAILAALLGGLVTALLGSWFNRLRTREVARLVVLAELMSNSAIHYALARFGPNDQPPAVLYSSSAWLTHRDTLAVPCQQDPELWLSLMSFYGAITSLRRFDDPLDEGLERHLAYAVANLSIVGLGTLGLVSVYGPRRALAMRRERRSSTLPVGHAPKSE